MSDLARMTKRLEAITDTVDLRVVGPDAGERGIFAFAENLVAAVKGIRLLPPDPDAAPIAGLRLESAGFTFCGIPQGGEVDPFCEILLQEASDLEAASVTAPVALRLFVSPHCPHCPAVLRTIARLLPDPMVTLTVVDVAAFSQVAADAGIKAVPTLLMEEDPDGMRWTGPVSLGEITARLREGNPTALGAESLQNLLESGGAERLARMMAAANQVFPAFFQVITHEKWTVRLGAMVTAEFLLQDSPALGEALLEGLWQERSSLDDTVLGDVAYLIGLSENRDWLGKLADLKEKGGSAALQDAVAEAMDALGR